jgi:ATP-dependent Clp protease ATP-binding subunit ClpA
MSTEPLWVCPSCARRVPLLRPCPSCQPGAPSPQAALGEAALALSSGRASLCVRLLRSISPGDDAQASEALELLRRALEQQGRWADAADALRRLRALRPGDAALSLSHASALQLAGRPEEALCALDEDASPDALVLRARALCAAPWRAAVDVAEAAGRLADEAGAARPELVALAGQAWAQAARGERDEARAQIWWRRATARYQRAWADRGPGASLELSLAYAEALSRASDRTAVELLESAADEGARSPAWHRAYLRALLASPSDAEGQRARGAAGQALELFPADSELVRLGQEASRRAWARRRGELAGLSGQAAQAGDAGEGADGDEELDSVSGTVPEFLSDVRARIRKGALPAVREQPDRQREIIEVLCRHERANAIVTGPPGCGKSSLLRAVAHQLHGRKGVPRMLRGHAIYELDPIAIVGGTDNVGVLEGRLTALARFCESNRLILFIDNFHLVLGAGSYQGRPAGLSELLQPLMSGSNVKIVAAASDESFDSLTKSVGLERRMTRVRAPAMSLDEGAALLAWMKPRLEEHYEQILPDAILPLTTRLADHHIKSRALPDSAIDLLERSCAKALVDGAHEVTSDHVLRALAQLLRVPLEQVQLDRMSRLLGLEALLASRVVGQRQAIEAVSNVIRMSKAELDLHPHRPDGVFLFVGPSGVGKTELARALAEILNPDPTGFVRLDMSEFTEPHNVSRLFGTTPGYVGFEHEGQLTGALRLNPGAVVLLDEVEKAHPKVYDVFLQVFDAGRMTDGRGRSVDCSHATFIMTSNLGTAELGEAKVGFLREEESREGRQRILRAALEKHFRPEFLNRLDAAVAFDALSAQTLDDIVRQKLALLRSRFASKGMEVHVDDALVPLISADTDRLRTGARGVIRAIERLIVIPLTREVLTHQPHRTFRVSVEHGAVKITLAHGAPGTPGTPDSAQGPSGTVAAPAATLERTGAR